MQILRTQFPILALTLLLALPAPAALAAEAEVETALSRSAAFSAELEAYQGQLTDLESRYGPYHRSLLEPLQGLTALAASDSDYVLVAQLQSRQLQVMRTVLGFTNPDLVPLLRDMIANELHLQNWQGITDHLEHIRYLAAANDDETNSLLEAIDQQASWYLAMVYLDSRERRARNFMEARELYEDLLDLAEKKFGEDSPQLIGWKYKHALSEYRLVELLNSSNGVASDTIDRLIRMDGVARLQARGRASLFGNDSFIPVVEEGRLIGEDYLRDAMREIADIVELEEQQGDLEAQAMALIYQADFQKMMSNGLAYRKYRDAMGKLEESGIPAEQVERFFSRPMLIPVPQLFLRFADAVAYQQQILNADEHPANPLSLGRFVAWDEGLPDVPRPALDAAIFPLDQAFDYADLTLTVNSSGSISSVEVINAVPAEKRVERRAYRAVRDLQVRPAIIDGKARRSRDVHIRYYLTAED